MRQAGRYLKEYRDVRATTSDFISFCLDPDKASEVTLQPIRRFQFDAAIIFSDILIVPWALGRDVHFITGDGPKCKPLQTDEVIDHNLIETFDDKIIPVAKAVSATRGQLPQNVSLIGFAGAPWTLMTYMVEGGSSKDYALSRNWLWGHRKQTDYLLEILVETISKSLISQAKAGANVLMLFDSWASAVPSELRPWIVERPVQAIIEKVRAAGITQPFICFPRGISADLPRFADSVDCQGLALDQGVSPEFAAQAIRSDVALQGNLDPQALLYGGDEMKRSVDKIKNAFQDRAHIFNLGHGITPPTPPEIVAELVAYVRN
ncbi:MAG: uroporphyrinogen decarboxylase [Candidatus Puniceispirillaceae bacterium]